MQAAGGLVGLAGEFAAGVEGAEDDLQSALVREFGVRIDGDAAAIVADGDGIIGVQFHLDAGGVARHGLVHRVVENFGDKVVQRALVGAADVHAGAFADRFQPLQHLDGGGVVGVGVLGAAQQVIGHGMGCLCSILWAVGPIMAGLGARGKGRGRLRGRETGAVC